MGDLQRRFRRLVDVQSTVVDASGYSPVALRFPGSHRIVVAGLCAVVRRSRLYHCPRHFPGAAVRSSARSHGAYRSRTSREPGAAPDYDPRNGALRSRIDSLGKRHDVRSLVVPVRSGEWAVRRYLVESEPDRSLRYHHVPARVRALVAEEAADMDVGAFWQ